jgi:hypothetical protein
VKAKDDKIPASVFQGNGECGELVAALSLIGLSRSGSLARKRVNFSCVVRKENMIA